MSFNPGPTVIKSGTYSNSTCTTEQDLMMNAIKKPFIQDWLDFVDQRKLMTLLTSGVFQPYGVKDSNTVRTEMPVIEDSKKVSDNAYRFNIIGSINQPSEILSQYGATSSDGTFQLYLKDNLLFEGMNALFHAGDFQARVMSNPTGGAGNFLYTFKTMDGRLFDWTTNVAGQSGAHTCIGVYTSYGEGSMRGYGRNVYPDTFIVHTTIQRGESAITGDAGSDVRWYQYQGMNGTADTGWMWEEVYQERARLSGQNEYMKWFGVSSMKNSDGTVKSVAPLDNYGMPIVTGDGVVPQIDGGNASVASGSDGMPTLDDFGDMVQSIVQSGNEYNGRNIVCVTGTDGYRHIQTIAPLLLAGQSTTIFMDKDNPIEKTGGAVISAGYEFKKLNFFGNSIHFIMHPMLDDTQKFTAYNSYGRLISASTYYFLTLQETGATAKNIEIYAKGKEGIDRSNIMKFLPGMTGRSGDSISTQDMDKYSFLKQDLIVVRRSKVCGILRPSA